MSFLKELLPYLIGEKMTVVHFTALCIFAAVGAAIKLTQQVRKRDVKSSATPVKFSWKFMFLDNGPRVVGSLLLIYIFLRFPAQFIPDHIYQAIPNDAEMVLAVAIGYCFDSLAQLLKDKVGILRVDRSAIKVETP